MPLRRQRLPSSGRSQLVHAPHQGRPVDREIGVVEGKTLGGREVRGLGVDQQLVERIDGDAGDQPDAHTQPHAAEEIHGFIERQGPGIAEKTIGAPHLVFDDRRRIAQEHLASLLLVVHHLPDHLPEVIEQLRFGLAESRLVGQLEEVAHHLAPLAVQPPERQTHLGKPLKHLGDFLGEHEPRQVDQNGRTKPRSDVGWARRKITELRVKCEGKSLPQFSVHAVQLGVGGVEREA